MLTGTPVMLLRYALIGLRVQIQSTGESSSSVPMNYWKFFA